MEPVIKFNYNSYGAKADEDMVNADAVISGHIGTPRAGIFWCEQAIEKYFKHIVSQQGDDRDLTTRHKLISLAKQAGYSASNEERYLLSELVRMYYERYPSDVREGEPEEPDWDDAMQAFKLASKIQKWTYSMVRKRAASAKQGLKQLNLF